MKAVILAAGEGRRLEPLTHVRPKPMVPIANQPLLEYVVEAVAEAGIDDVLLVVGYKRERIQSYFADGDDWDVDIEYAVQDKQLGTGHAILQAESRVDDDFLVLNGDRIIDAELVDRLAATDTPAPAVSVTRVSSPLDYGVVELDGETVARIVEKPGPDTLASELINAGVYRFDPSVFAAIRATETTAAGELAITDTLTRLLSETTVHAVRYRGVWLDVSYLWDLLTVNAGVIDEGRTGTADSARIHGSATVSVATSIGADAAVQPGARVLRNTALGANVRVGPNAVVSNAVVLPDVTIDAGAVVSDCVVGENVHLGPNTTIEGNTADVVVDDTVHHGVRLGGVIGDNTTIGGNVTVAPGTVLGDGATVQGGASIAGRFPSDADVRRG